MSNQLIDNHGRTISYLRLSITDRCNLRCFYCMPEQGVELMPKAELLTFEEILRLVQISSEMGIKKVRLTGGEPFVRKDSLQLITAIRQQFPALQLAITTNGILLQQHLPALHALGVTDINLSLDCLNPELFHRITRRNEFEKVYAALLQMLEMGFNVKVNMVVMDGVNTHEIVTMAYLAKDFPLEVRYIEEMPFNGVGVREGKFEWNEKAIIATLANEFPIRVAQKVAGETAQVIHVDGFKGNLGVIAAYTRSFCGTCNRLRVTAQGQLKTCLYDNGAVDLRALLRSTASDEVLKMSLLQAVSTRYKDGFEAEADRINNPIHESMSIIGG